MAKGWQVRALRKGAHIMGGEARLCALLDAAPAAFVRWREGDESMPEDAFAMLLEFLADMESDTLPPG